MTDEQIIILGNIITIILLLIAYGVDFCIVFRGKFCLGVLWGWFLSFILMFILSIIGSSLWQSHPEQIDIIKSVFPDGIIAAPFSIFGWMPALVVAGLDWLGLLDY